MSGVVIFLGGAFFGMSLAVTLIALGKAAQAHQWGERGD